MIHLYWADKQKAIIASKELSNQLRRTIYVVAKPYGFAPYDNIEYVLKNDSDIIDLKSKSIVHKQEFQPGKESEKNNKNILEILEQKGEK